MKKFASKAVFVVIIVALVSCVSLQDRTMTPQERSTAEVVGTVTTSWTSYSFMHIPPSKDNLKTRALSELKKEAAKQGFTGNIDIRNISVTQTASPITIAFLSAAIFMDLRTNTASGDVVLYSTDSGRSRALEQTVEGALERAADEVSKNFTPRSRIAIVQITAPDRSTREFITGELEYILHSRGFYIVDRAELDKVWDEQRFGATDDVDDKTMARAGLIAGANVIIIGGVDGGEGSLRRLRLRALDTQTEQVVGNASERL